MEYKIISSKFTLQTQRKTEYGGGAAVPPRFLGA